MRAARWLSALVVRHFNKITGRQAEIDLRRYEERSRKFRADMERCFDRIPVVEEKPQPDESRA